MEKVPFENVQVKVKVEPEEVGSYEKWGSVEPVPKRARKAWDLPEPTEEEEYFKDRGWAPETATQKKSTELRIEYEKDRIILEDGLVWYRTDRKTYELFRGSFFDSRWFRSVYYDERTQQYESRAPYPQGSAPKPVLWEAPEGWTVETRAEFEERRKHWKKDGIRLEHEDAVPGAKHELYEHPDHPVVRIVAVNSGKLPPKVLVKHEGTNLAWWVFSDELEKETHNTKRNIKNWQKRRRYAFHTSGTTIWDTVTLTEGPPDDFKTPSFPDYRLATTA